MKLAWAIYKDCLKTRGNKEVGVSFVSVPLIIRTVLLHRDKLCHKHCCLLDGVQEVAYIHSNQNVIGSSRAENHMSRWATRDVFELKQFSQLPANVAVCSSEVRKVSF